MSDTETADLTVETDQDTDLVKRLRKALKDKNRDLKARDETIDALNGTVRESVFEKAGVPEKARKALTTLAKDVEGFEWNPESVRTLAEDNGYTLAAAPDGEGQPTGGTPPAQDEVTAHRQQQQQRRTDAMGAGAPPPAGPPDVDSQSKAAVEARDFRSAIALQRQKLASAS